MRAAVREPAFIEGAVFDMDGLMFDTERLFIDSARSVCEKRGISVPDETFKEMIGRNYADSASVAKRALGEDFDFDKFYAEIARQKRLYIDKNGAPVKEGLYELLDFLSSRGVKLAVATSSDKKSAEPLLKNAGVWDFFDAAVFGNQIEHGKPAPDIFLRAAQALALDHDRCLALEDSEPGLIAAFLAGMKTVFVPDIANPSDTVLKRVWRVCGDLNEVIDCADAYIIDAKDPESYRRLEARGV